MNYFPEYTQLVLQEIPNEISVCISLAGCSHCCPNCHSPHLQDKNGGEFMLLENLNEICEKYKAKATCVLFFGGEHSPERLIRMTKICHQFGFKTGLYSGFSLHELSPELIASFEYLKTGSYKEELGGLDKKTTNQRLWKRVDGELVDITAEMQRE